MSDNKVSDPLVIKNAASSAGKNHLFPVFLKMEELNVLLVGGGKVGLEKLNAILQNAPAASVWVVATEIAPEIKLLAVSNPGIVLEERPFHEDDLENKEVVIVAVNDKAVSKYVRLLAKERKLLVNVADTPELCDFYLGSIVQKGDLKIAISTNGKSPTVAKRLKEVLNKSLPAELDITLQQMSELRNSLSGDFAYKVKKLNEVTSVLVDKKPQSKGLIWIIWGAI